MLIYLSSSSRFAQGGNFSRKERKKKKEQPCLKCCFRNLPSHPGTPALPSSLQGCLPPSHSARWAAGTLAQHSLSTAPALFTHLEKQTGGGGCSGITHQTHCLPRGFRHFQGGNPQGCTGETPAASPDLSTSSRLGPGCPCEPRHPRELARGLSQAPLLWQGQKSSGQAVRQLVLLPRPLPPAPFLLHGENSPSPPAAPAAGLLSFRGDLWQL